MCRNQLLFIILIIIVIIKSAKSVLNDGNNDSIISKLEDIPEEPIQLVRPDVDHKRLVIVEQNVKVFVINLCLLLIKQLIAYIL
jgi:hypothetical protein